jgi:hypothetical protein
MRPIKKNLAWHYTTGEKFLLIVESGELRPTDIGVSYPEKPILWFSLEQKWEPTACKAILENGELKTLSMEETFEYGKGLVRFGIRLDSLHHWKKLIRKSQMAADMVKQLESTGLQQGADKNLWYGSIGIIPLSRCKSIQVMNNNGEWQEVSPS